MLWWLSVAPLGKPVVPLVYCRLIGSSALSEPLRSRSSSSPTASAPDTSSSQSGPSSTTTRSRPADVAADLLDHGRVVRGLVRAGRDQHPRARLVQHVLQLRRPVGRVHVHQDHAGLGGGVLGQHPLDPVGRPQRQPVALLQPRGHQRPRQLVDLRVQLGVGQPHVLVRAHQRLALADPGHGAAPGRRRSSGPAGASRTSRANTTASCSSLLALGVNVPHASAAPVDRRTAGLGRAVVRPSPCRRFRNTRGR